MCLGEGLIALDVFSSNLPPGTKANKAATLINPQPQTRSDWTDNCILSTSSHWINLPHRIYPHGGRRPKRKSWKGNTGRERAMDTEGFGCINNNGERLSDLCVENNLVIG